MKYILKSTKTKIEGIVLPFNLGKEVFIVHNIWLVFSDYYKQKVNKVIKKNNSYWILLEKRKEKFTAKKS